MNNEKDFIRDDYSGKNIWYGVCEFVMGVVMNGIVLYGGLKIYGGMFFVFFDYLCLVICFVVLM